MYSDQGYSSVFVNWTKQVYLQTRLKWLQWWGTPDINWNRVPDRRRSKRKWTINKCCLTVCRSIEKRHGVWAGVSVAGVQWLSMQHVSDIWWCSIAVTVVAQTSYFVGASYFDRKPMKWFYVYGYTRWIWKAHEYSSCIFLYPLQVGCHITSRTKQQWVTVVTSWQDKADTCVAVAVLVRNLRIDAKQRSSKWQDRAILEKKKEDDSLMQSPNSSQTLWREIEHYL